jgi:hypothetical protein
MAALPYLRDMMMNRWFNEADADKNKLVSKGELVRFETNAPKYLNMPVIKTGFVEENFDSWDVPKEDEEEGDGSLTKLEFTNFMQAFLEYLRDYGTQK